MPDELLKSGPGIVVLDLVEGLQLAEKAQQGMIVSILEDAKSQHSQVWDIYVVVQLEEPIGTRGPSGLSFIGQVFQRHQVQLQARNNVSLEPLGVHDQ